MNKKEIAEYHSWLGPNLMKGVSGLEDASEELEELIERISDMAINVQLEKMREE